MGTLLWPPTLTPRNSTTWVFTESPPPSWDPARSARLTPISVPALTAQAPAEGAEGVEVEVGDPLLERDDAVVGDVDVLRTDLRAALGDVAHRNSSLALEQRAPVDRVLWMQLQPGDPDHEARPEECVLTVVVAQDVTDVLAEEAFDALAKLGDAIDV